MKQLLLLAATINVFSFCNVNAQNPVPNPGFENWTAGNPDSWQTTNVPGIITTVTQAQPGHSGSYAIKGQPQTYMGQAVPPLLTSSDVTGTGFPVSMSYSNLVFYYKFNQVAGDILYVSVALLDAAGGGTGAGTLIINTPSSSFVQATVPITNFGGTPASCLILFLIEDQAGGGTPNTGSYYIIDDVSLTGPTAIAFNNSTSNEMNVFPKPASQSVNIIFNNNNTSTQQFVLYDINGSKVDAYNFDNCVAGINTKKIDISNFKNGVYYLRSIDGTKATPVVVMH